MGKELPLAREEEEGQPVLLASPGTRQFIYAPSSRDKGTQEPSPSKGSKGRKAKGAKTKSKGGRKAERANARHSEPARRGRGYKNREQGRGDEGENKPIRRNAQELGVTYPGSYCDELKTVPHYWLEDSNVDKGSLFQCKLCHRYVWLPLSTYDAELLGDSMKKHGHTEGYCRYLNRHRPAKLMVAKLQDLRRLEKEIVDKRKFARLTDKILSDKEYDRKEVKE